MANGKVQHGSKRPSVYPVSRRLSSMMEGGSDVKRPPLSAGSAYDSMAYPRREEQTMRFEYGVEQCGVMLHRSHLG